MPKGVRNDYSGVRFLCNHCEAAFEPSVAQKRRALNGAPIVCSRTCQEIRDSLNKRTPGGLAVGGLKTCCRCHQTKAVDEYSAGRRRKDGLQPQCKDCIARYSTPQTHKRAYAARIAKMSPPEIAEARRRENQRYRSLHPEAGREADRRDREHLRDRYIKTVLGLTGDVPQPLIEAKRAHILLTREMRKTK